jgi:nitroreductase
MVENDALELLMRRRSIRKYTGQPVAKAELEQLLKAAMAAPTAANGKPWEFVVVTDPTVLAGLREVLPYGKMAAPAVIVVCCNLAIAENPVAAQYWQQDCSVDAENILTEATSLGLGSVWVGVYPFENNIKGVISVLKLPEGVTPLCALYLGHPAESFEPRSQYEEKRVHWQVY